MRELDFSLFYFASADDGWEAPARGAEQYRLVLEGTRFADRHGFAAVWTPERHFHAFGGLFPNPSVLGAALAMATERVAIRAGSVVLPLHHPARVAEEWAVVDSLSNGRVGLAFATGWHARDFALAPERYEGRKRDLPEAIAAVRALWRGETVSFPNGVGVAEPLRLRPRPVQPELPIWLTAAESVETFRLAGSLGAGLLTHLLNQDVPTLASKIAAYREARLAHGHLGPGHVTLMVHTHLGPDEAAVRARAEAPFADYLADAIDLAASTSGSHGLGAAALPEALKAKLIARAAARFWEGDALLGTPEACLPRVLCFQEAGVDELACLIDFGLSPDDALAGLDSLAELKRLAAGSAPPVEAARGGLDRAAARREALSRRRAAFEERT